MKITTKKQLTVLLAALTMAAPQIGANFTNLQNTPLGVQTAEAQNNGRGSYKRGRDYRDDDLNRLSWTTQRGVVTSTPGEDYLEMRTDDGQNFRVVTRNNVSLNNIVRNDRIEVYGKRDGGILIGYKVSELRGSSNNNSRETIRGTAASDFKGNYFLIRINNNTYNVIVRDGEPNNFRSGRAVEATGYWKDGAFHADSVRMNGNNNDNNWNERKLQGTVLSDNGNRRFSMRLDNGRNVDVIYDERNPRRLSRGDKVEVEGRWDRNSQSNSRDDVFRANSVRILNNDSNTNERTLRGVIVTDNDNRRFVLRTYDRRDITVVSDERNPRRLSRGDTVEVEGRWDRNERGNARDNVFRANSVRIVSNTGNNNGNNNDTRVDFRGEITRASQVGGSWDYIVRSQGRDYPVRFNEKFRIGDRVRVVGVLRNGRVTASDIDRA